MNDKNRTGVKKVKEVKLNSNESEVVNTSTITKCIVNKCHWKQASHQQVIQLLLLSKIKMKYVN